MKWLTQAWAPLKCLLTKLLDSRDPSADSLVVGLMVIAAPLPIVALICATSGHAFDFQGYGIGGGALLGGAGGGVGARALMSGKPKPRDEPEREGGR